ncbi:AMP-binding enzyme [Colletotrichum higginsianum IMI 349063]|uniref:AMP-binding enzyme n=2 Tax=Colletotrichum higginsianum TaxID=80884 RepID=A0A1B7YC62_COLHI|nr:AMP-binding enzyme [Colletotrichum higginsianum IMI 349063]OBR09711.1 AMP-binding enzyme [Colletotrichum higginsianum IMI 349063]TID06200.1 putative acyl--CoA ligase YdaB [Colletotrichum higginsianum]
MNASASTSPGLSEAEGPPLDLSGVPDVWDGFRSAIKDHPNELALVCTHQPHNLFGFPSFASPGPEDNSITDEPPPAYLRWTFQTLAQAIHKLVLAKKSSAADVGLSGELGPGTPVITFLRNGADFVLAAWASVVTGCTLTPLNPLTLKNRDEASHMLRTALSLAPDGHKLRVIYAADSDVAKNVDELDADILGAHSIKILASGSEARDGWLHLDGLVRALDASGSGDLSLYTPLAGLEGKDHAQAGIVLFTSGSTSRPKGLFCRHAVLNTYTNSRLLLSPPHLLPQPGSRVCSILPNNHGNGWTCIQTAHGRGAALVFPGPAFSTPEALLSTLRRERITHTLLVPTLVHALVAVMEKGQPPLESLLSVTFGGMILTKQETLATAKILGANAIENAYGCTEGVLTSTGSVVASGPDPHMSSSNDQEEVSVGRPPMGHGIKIVDPATGCVVPRNVTGEIHGYGPMISREGRWSYIGDEQNKAFYIEKETGRVWFQTGDMGRMDEKGDLFIVGRYKDMIIRGGENISPAAIEAVLMKNSALRTLDPQVVGVRDTIAGEVPAVVIKGDQPGAAVEEAVRETVLQHMTRMHVPDVVIHLKDLGQKDFPRTTSGKIQKFKLKQLVATHLDNQAAPQTSGISSGLGQHEEEQVKAIWTKAIGLGSSSQLDVNAPLGQYIDSITMMRVRDKIRKQTGVALPLAAMAQAATFAEQMKLLHSLSAGRRTASMATEVGAAHLARQQERISAANARIATRGRAFSTEDMADSGVEPELYEFVKDRVLEVISPHGLGWDDVEDVGPAYDANAVQAQCGFYDTINFNMAISTKKAISKRELRSALEAAMLNHPIMCSFMIWDADWRSVNPEPNEALHIIMRPSARYFDLAIQDGGAVRSLKDVEDIALGQTAEARRFPAPQQNTFPGPLYRVMLLDVEETGTVAMVTSGNHSITDHSAGQLFYDDLDRAVALAVSPSLASSGSTAASIQAQLPEHKDYKSYLDLHRAVRSSPRALASTKWHVDRLSSLPQHVDAGALWPSPKSWMHVSLEDHYRESHQLQHGFSIRVRPADPTGSTPIPISTIVKAAMAIASARRSGYTTARATTGARSRVAVFSSVEAARSHYNPFLPPSVTATEPAHRGEEHNGSLRWEAGDVAGPTVQIVCNVVEMPRCDRESVETVSQFLGRMQREQELQTKHASAPWRAIMDRLEDPNAMERPWPLLPLVHGTLMFNWAPGLGESARATQASAEDARLSQFENLDMLKSVQKPRVGLVVSAGASSSGPGATGSDSGSVTTVFLHLRGAGLGWGSDGGMLSFAREIEEMTRWLSADENKGLPLQDAFGGRE